MKNPFCENTNWCFRRIMGTLGFLSSIVAIFLGIKHDGLPLLMMLSASLLGITTIDKFTKTS